MAHSILHITAFKYTVGDNYGILLTNMADFPLVMLAYIPNGPNSCILKEYPASYEESSSSCFLYENLASFENILLPVNTSTS
jgi:hypothetical protein